MIGAVDVQEGSSPAIICPGDSRRMILREKNGADADDAREGLAGDAETAEGRARDGRGLVPGRPPDSVLRDDSRRFTAGTWILLDRLAAATAAGALRRDAECRHHDEHRHDECRHGDRGHELRVC